MLSASGIIKKNCNWNQLLLLDDCSCWGEKLRRPEPGVKRKKHLPFPSQSLSVPFTSLPTAPLREWPSGELCLLCPWAGRVRALLRLRDMACSPPHLNSSYAVTLFSAHLLASTVNRNSDLLFLDPYLILPKTWLPTFARWSLRQYCLSFPTPFHFLWSTSYTFILSRLITFRLCSINIILPCFACMLTPKNWKSINRIYIRASVL